MATNKVKTLEDLELELDDLVANQQTIMGQRADLKQKAVAVQAEIDQVTAAIEARRKLARMSDSQKRALMQQIEAEGIASGEAIGEPGG